MSKPSLLPSRPRHTLSHSTPKVLSLEAARAKRLKAGPCMRGRVTAGRVQVSFSQPVEAFHLSAQQARYWSRAFADLADVAEAAEDSATGPANGESSA